MLLGCLRRVATTRERERLELTWKRADGVVFADAAFTWVPDSDPNAAMILISFRDIGDRKKAETELRERLQQERRLNELKARFTSMVSHEFRTPLAVMQASTDILKLYDQRIGPEKRHEHIDKIQEQIQRLASLQEEVLQLSRAESIGLALKLEPVRLVDYCRKLIEEYQPLAPHHRLAFISAGPDREVMLDLRLIRDALSNLLSNGVKYSFEGSVVTLELDCEQDPIRIVVQDHGIGIPEQDLTRIFDAFHRARNVEQRQGTGLGLTIVKRAIEAHGGTVSVESVVGSGTSFTLQLPLSRS